jgi:hypothetical protein
MQSETSDAEQAAVHVIIALCTTTAVDVTMEDRRHDGTSRVDAPSHLSTVHALSMTKAMLTALCSTSVVATAAGAARAKKPPTMSDCSTLRLVPPPMPKPLLSCLDSM